MINKIAVIPITNNSKDIKMIIMSLILVVGVARLFHDRRRRHDVAPKKTSRVFHRFSGHEAVDGILVFPPVVVEVEKAAAEGPPCGKAPGRLCHVAKGSVTQVLEDGVAGRQLLENGTIRRSARHQTG